jgi:mRNA-degrading endonuclease RelE of RelBE toxin-antitoxin system
LAKRERFTLVVDEAAKAELAALRAFEKKEILDSIETNLTYEPLGQSRRRKPLGGLQVSFPHTLPLWELKVGEFRVFYNVDESQRTVRVRSVRRKPPGVTTQEVVK